MSNSRQFIWRKRIIVCNIVTVLLIIAVCFYYGIIYVNGKILLVGFALLLLLLVSAAELIYRYMTILAHMEIPISIAEQENPFHLGICIKNKGILPAGRVRVCIGIKNAFEKRETSDWVSISAAPCGTESFDSKIVLQQVGNHEICIKKMRIYSITGLLFVNKTCKDMGNVLVMPKIHAVGVKLSESTRHFVADAEVYDEMHAGHDVTEIFEIRSYQPKDKLQNIHWKLSAKMDELMVKENGLPKACSIVLLAEAKRIKTMSINAFLELFVSLSFSLMDAKCPHFVAWYSKEKEDITRVRVDDEESYYLFLNHYLTDVNFIEKTDIRAEYQEKYKGEIYLHDICISGDLQIYCDGEFFSKLDAKNIEDGCKELELLL